MKRPWFYIFSILFLIFLYLNYTELTHITNIIRGGSPLFLVLAALSQFASYTFLAFAHKQSLSIVKIQRTLKQSYRLMFIALATNVTAPTGGTIGSVVFAKDATDHGESGMAALAGIILLMIMDVLSISSLIFFSIYYLNSIHQLRRSYVLAVVVFFAIAAVLVTVLVISAKRPGSLKRTFHYFIDKYNKFLRYFKKEPIRSFWIEPSVNELSIASKLSVKHLRGSLDTLFFLVLTHAMGIVTLFFTFKAFEIDPKVSVVIICYVVVLLFKIVTPTPEGIGFAEGALALSLNSFGVIPINAAAIALTFRFLNFWLPFGLGFVFLQHSNLKPQKIQ